MSITTSLNFLKRSASIGLIAGAGWAVATPSVPAATLLQENFNDITALPGSGWVLTNNSSPLGTTGWFQGNDGIFTAQAGAANAYIAANYNNAAVGGNISNWLISPVLTLANGDTIAFYTRAETGATFADRLELRLSTSGASTDVGATDASVGDFGTLLLTVNPALLLPGGGGYPETWTLFSATVGGLGGPTSSRFAFRYAVPDSGTHGDYIGIDTVSVTEAMASVPEPATLGLFGLGLASLARRHRR
jgi:hypothetical protein